MLAEAQNYIERGSRWLWRGGRHLVTAMRAGDSFSLVRKGSAHLPAPVSIGLIVAGWFPRWTLHTINEIQKDDDALQTPSIPTSVTLLSTAAAALAGIGAVAGFYGLFGDAQAVLSIVPGIGAITVAIAGTATAVYMLMKFDDFRKALTPDEKDFDDKGLTLRERASTWARNFFTYDRFFHIDRTKDTTRLHHVGKVGGTLIALGSSIFFAAVTLPSLPVALPLAVAGCTAYGLGEFFDAKDCVADFYGHVKESMQWLTGYEVPKDRLADSKRWNALPFWKRGPLYLIAGGITASLSVPIAVLSPPVWIAPVGILMTTFLYPLFLSGIKMGFNDPKPVCLAAAEAKIPTEDDRRSPALKAKLDTFAAHNREEEGLGDAPASNDGNPILRKRRQPPPELALTSATSGSSNTQTTKTTTALRTQP